MLDFNSSFLPSDSDSEDGAADKQNAYKQKVADFRASPMYAVYQTYMGHAIWIKSKSPPGNYLQGRSDSLSHVEEEPADSEPDSPQESLGKDGPKLSFESNFLPSDFDSKIGAAEKQKDVGSEVRNSEVHPVLGRGIADCDLPQEPQSRLQLGHHSSYAFGYKTSAQALEAQRARAAAPLNTDFSFPSLAVTDAPAHTAVAGLRGVEVPARAARGYPSGQNLPLSHAGTGKKLTHYEPVHAQRLAAARAAVLQGMIMILVSASAVNNSVACSYPLNLTVAVPQTFLTISRGSSRVCNSACIVPG